MNSTLRQSKEVLIPAPAEFAELVRGNEQALFELFAPYVREHDTILDMANIRRIDAAGIAALISVYGSARRSGHTFRVCNATPHVAEILKVVSLDNILVARDGAGAHYREACLECPAA